MDNQNEVLKNNIAKNLAAYRKKAGLTQSALAEMINYSDKAVSKWERGDGVPDIYVLKKTADIFGISVEQLISDPDAVSVETQPVPEKQPYLNRKRKLIISAISIMAVWLIATLTFSAMEMTGTGGKSWLAFIYALPVSMVVAICFGAIWGGAFEIMISVSGFAWSLALSAFLSVSIDRKWLIFIIIVPVQAIIILATNLAKTPVFKRKNKPTERESEDNDNNRGENL